MHDRGQASRTTLRHEASLAEFSLGLPEAYEENPWDHRAMKVRKKTFVFLAASGEGLSLSLKLTDSHREALLLPFTEPTGYGLGKSGWVSSRFPPGEKPPLALLMSWIEESFRAVAPKKVVALLDGEAPRPKKRAKKKAAKKKAVKKKASKKAAKKKKRSTRRSPRD